MLAPLQPIPDDAVDLSFPAPQYSNDFASIVGNAGSDSDGFDSLFNEAAAMASTMPDIFAGLDIALGLVETSMPGVDKPWEQDFSDTLSGSIAQGDPDFAVFDVHMTGNSPPPASGTQPGGGTQTQKQYTTILTISATVDNFFTQKQIFCTAVVGPKTASLPPQQPAPNSGSWDFGETVYGGQAIRLTGEIVNEGNYPFEITGIALSADSQSNWDFQTSGYPSTFAPGDSFRLSITFYPPKS